MKTKKFKVETEVEIFYEGSTVKFLKVNRVTLTPHGQKRRIPKECVS